MPAATSAPKATTRITIVTGSERRPARSRSWLNLSSSCFSALTPNSSIRRLGLAAAAPSTASITGWILSVAVSASPRISRLTVAEWPSAEIWPRLPAAYGLCTLVTTLTAETRRTTSATAALNAGLSAVCFELWTSTVSPAGCLNPSSSIRAARPDSPGSVSVSVSCLVPSAPPSTTAATTNASQPKIAVLRWRALQRPIRAATLVLRFMGDMRVSPCGVGVPARSHRRDSMSVGWTGVCACGAPPSRVRLPSPSAEGEPHGRVAGRVRPRPGEIRRGRRSSRPAARGAGVRES